MCARPLRLHDMLSIHDSKHCNQLIVDHSSIQIHLNLSVWFCSKIYLFRQFCVWLLIIPPLFYSVVMSIRPICCRRSIFWITVYCNNDKVSSSDMKNSCSFFIVMMFSLILIISFSKSPSRKALTIILMLSK